MGKSMITPPNGATSGSGGGQTRLWGDERCLYCKQMFRVLGRREPENPQYCSRLCRKSYKRQKSTGSLLDSKAEQLMQAKLQQGQGAGASTGNDPTTPPGAVGIMGLLGNSPTSSAFTSTHPSAMVPIQTQPARAFHPGAEGSPPTFNFIAAQSQASAASYPIYPSHPSLGAAMDWSSGNSRGSPSMLPSLQSHQNPRQSLMGSPAPTTSATPLPTAVSYGPEVEALMGKGVQNWTVHDVARWVNAVTGSETNGERFVQDEIDGTALLMLNCHQLQNELGMKLGPAVKLNNALNRLKGGTGS